VSASLKTPKNLTFSELQTLIEQGKTDEIPSNKPIPDALNVGLVLTPYHISMTVPLAGDPSQSVERSATQKALGARFTVRMTLEWDTSPVIYTFG
jgi:predicted component of type VI protein secretion system